MEINRYNWSDVPEEIVNPLFTRQAIHTPQMTVLQLRLKKGAVVPLHHHVHEQVTLLASGSLRVELNGETLVLQPGDVLLVPSNAPHLVEALEDSVETDVFTPTREDLKPKS